MSIKTPQLLILGGAPRAGKTTIARALSSEQHRIHLSVDSVVHAFEKTYPEAKIHHLGNDDQEVATRVNPFILEQVRWHVRHKLPLIIEGYHLEPETIASEWNEFSYRAVFMGYPKISPLQYVATVRKNEMPGDWTLNLSNNELQQLASRFIAASVRFEKLCAQTRFPFVNVSDSLDESARQVVALLKDNNPRNLDFG